jgi:hypothetical protein
LDLKTTQISHNTEQNKTQHTDPLYNHFSSHIFCHSEDIGPLIVLSFKMLDTLSTKSSSPKAVVIMFGWLGSNLKHVRKYASLYVQRDCTVIMSCPFSPLPILFQLEGPMRHQALASVKEAARVLRNAVPNCDVVIAENNDQSPAVLVHYFSNGGAFVAQALERLISDAKSESSSFSKKLRADDVQDILLVSKCLATRGFEVVDSAPAYITIPSAQHAIDAAIPNVLIRFLIKSALLLSYLIHGFIVSLQGRIDPPQEFWNRMISSELCSRQAFIYSSCDKVTDAAKVEELIEKRRARGVDITVTKFDQSQHVMHLRHYPNEYQEIVEKVLEQVMAMSVLSDSSAKKES